MAEVNFSNDGVHITMNAVKSDQVKTVYITFQDNRSGSEIKGKSITVAFHQNDVDILKVLAKSIGF